MAKISRTHHVTKQGTVKRNPAKYINDDLKTLVKRLRTNGFRIFTTSEDPIRWIYFSKDGKIGTAQADRLGHMSFSTVHKPNRTTGTGFRMTDEYAEPTIENANLALMFAPDWATNSDRKSIKKYSSVDEWLKSEKVLRVREL